ncbi:hypothetical protein [Candidatus Nitrosocosmicus franklandus]|uniref:Uncharacterized protein n=1 Tax=Candidatus Nitrosocosmicus franklandianus TaxID=1798806 RepID=A0A484IDY4_9ARCH|nr:hypothetical protein [Candidatus Nitrosocosmicus franklandus]VFJ14957.1 protein of unknown function [Candidatus Nitrosocosmicus franklandus]
MFDEKNNKGGKKIPEGDLERQRIIDKGGTQKYGADNQQKTKDKNILIDSEH